MLQKSWIPCDGCKTQSRAAALAPPQAERHPLCLLIGQVFHLQMNLATRIAEKVSSFHCRLCRFSSLTHFEFQSKQQQRQALHWCTKRAHPHKSRPMSESGRPQLHVPHLQRSSERQRRLVGNSRGLTQLLGASLGPSRSVLQAVLTARKTSQSAFASPQLASVAKVTRTHHARGGDKWSLIATMKLESRSSYTCYLPASVSSVPARYRALDPLVSLLCHLITSASQPRATCSSMSVRIEPSCESSSAAHDCRMRWIEQQ